MDVEGGTLGDADKLLHYRVLGTDVGMELVLLSETVEIVKSNEHD